MSDKPINEEQMRAIIGGIFGLGKRILWNENGEAVEVKEKFNIRLYKDLWTSGAIQRLKGNKLGVFLTIAIHADQDGEGWPDQRRIADLLGLNKDTVGKAVRELEEDGFVERELTRREDGTFYTKYKLKFAPDPEKWKDTSPKKPDRMPVRENRTGDQSEKTGQEPSPKKSDISNNHTTTENPLNNTSSSRVEEPTGEGTNWHTEGGNAVPALSADPIDVVEFYASMFGDMNPFALRRVINLEAKHGALLVKEAIQRAADGKAEFPASYIEKVLDNWANAGVVTLEDVEKYEEAHRNRAAKPRKPAENREQRKDNGGGHPFSARLPKYIEKQLEEQEAGVGEPQPVDPEAEARIRAKIKQLYAKAEKKNKHPEGEQL